MGFNNYHDGWAVSLTKLSHMALNIGLQRASTIPNDDIHLETM